MITILKLVQYRSKNQLKLLTDFESNFLKMTDFESLFSKWFTTNQTNKQTKNNASLPIQSSLNIYFDDIQRNAFTLITLITTHPQLNIIFNCIFK